MLFFFQAELKKKYSEEQLPATYASLENILKSNKGGDGFLVGDAVRSHDISPLLYVEDYVCVVGFRVVTIIVIPLHTDSTLHHSVVANNTHIPDHAWQFQLYTLQRSMQ